MTTRCVVCGAQRRQGGCDQGGQGDQTLVPLAALGVGAIDPVTKLLVAIDVGERTQAMAQRFVHHVTQVRAPDWAPLFLTDGLREYLTALLTH